MAKTATSSTRVRERSERIERLTTNKKVSINKLIIKNTPLKEVLKLAAPCRCNACNHGCKLGSGLLAGDDAKNIASFLGISEEMLKEQFLEEVEQFNTRLLKPKLLRDKKPYGKCIFYDEEKGCKIHPVKPLQCKTSISCKDYGEDLAIWFMVNFAVNPNDPESIRQFAQYIKSHGKLIPGASLQELVPDKEKLKKILSYEMLK